MSWKGEEQARGTLLDTSGQEREPSRIRTGLDRLTGLVRLIGHADLRWHLWIVLALVGRLDLALAAYAGYFPARAVAGVVRKGVRHA